MFQTNVEVHAVSIGHKHDRHRPVANVTAYQKGVCYAGIKVSNKLPINIE
jgi:hypothetical protein